MPISKKRKPKTKPRPKGQPGMSQRGYSLKAFRRRGQQISPEDLVRLIVRVARSKGSQHLHRLRRRVPAPARAPGGR